MAEKVITTETVYDAESATQSGSVNDRTANKVQYLIYIIFAIISTLLVTRLALALFLANQNQPLVAFIFALTEPLVAVFRGIFAPNAAVSGVRFEVETLLALIGVVFIGWLLQMLAGLGKRNPQS